MSEILDSGARRQFESGAVRDVAEGKGRCDLLPLREVAFLLSGRRTDGPQNVRIVITNINIHHEYRKTSLDNLKLS